MAAKVEADVWVAGEPRVKGMRKERRAGPQRRQLLCKSRSCHTDGVNNVKKILSV